MRPGLCVVVLALACPLAVVAAAPSAPGPQGTIAFTLDVDVWTIHADGTRRTRVTRDGLGTEPAWSADGKRILFVRRGDGGLYTTRPDGRDLRLVFRPNRALGIRDPDWAVDGRIAFAGVEPALAGALGRPNGIWVVDGSGIRRLDQLGSSPAWSPSGTRMAYTRRDGSDLREVVIAAGRDAPTRVATGHSPAWSPDASRLAFVDGTGAVATVNADGSGARVVVGCGRAPAWSPDGRWLAYLSCRNDFRTQLYVVPAAGGRPTRLTRYAGSYGAPDWRPSGE